LLRLVHRVSIVVAFLIYSHLCIGQILIDQTSTSMSLSGAGQSLEFREDGGLMLTIPSGIGDALCVDLKDSIWFALAPEQFAFDFYSNILRFDSLLDFKGTTQTIRSIISPPERSDDGYVFAGIYFVHGSNGNGSVTRKLVKL